MCIAGDPEPASGWQHQQLDVTDQLGNGTYRSVLKATNKETGDVVVITHMKHKCHFWQEAVTLRKIESLWRLSLHPHIVKIHDYMPDGNLYELIKKCTPTKDSPHHLMILNHQM
eukprot:10356273-Ditylum_brightwellii.AAC.1